MDLELLDNFKNDESDRAASAKDNRAIKKAFARMTYDERILYFALDLHAGLRISSKLPNAKP